MSDSVAKLVDKVRLVVRMCGDERLTDADLRVAVAQVLAFFNTLTGKCNPSLTVLAKASTKCRDTVIEANKKLVALHYAVIERSTGGRNRRNAYRFDFTMGNVGTVDGSDHFDDAELVGTSGINGRNQWHNRSTAPTRIEHRKEHRKGKTKKSSGFRELWKPSPQCIATLTEKGHSTAEIDAELEPFKDYHLMKGSVFVDWDAAFRTWMRNARKFAAERCTQRDGKWRIAFGTPEAEAWLRYGNIVNDGDISVAAGQFHEGGRGRTPTGCSICLLSDNIRRGGIGREGRFRKVSVGAPQGAH